MPKLNHFHDVLSNLGTELHQHFEKATNKYEQIERFATKEYGKLSYYLFELKEKVIFLFKTFMVILIILDIFIVIAISIWFNQKISISFKSIVSVLILFFAFTIFYYFNYENKISELQRKISFQEKEISNREIIISNLSSKVQTQKEEKDILKKRT